MRKQLYGLDNTANGAKFARERLIYKDGQLIPNAPTVIIRAGRRGYYLDIIEKCNTVHRLTPRLRLV